LFIQDVIVLSNQKIAENTLLLEVESADLSSSIKPGQFFNIQVNDSSYPLLRRPFSISDVIGTSIFFMYKVIGEGTKIMSEKKKGDKVNLLGPLGNSFETVNLKEHLILIGGGIGIAPFPYVIKKIGAINYTVLFGVRNKKEVHEYGMKNISYSSDDGSIGLHGNVIELLDEHLANIVKKDVRIFACGPNPMLRALQKYVKEKKIDCDVSMESAMACGFGICQGCPIEYKEKEDAYKLVCKDGPIFNIRDIKI
jgi:dihydroorotate dehydrogenase electron transfer subunit